MPGLCHAPGHPTTGRAHPLWVAARARVRVTATPGAARGGGTPGPADTVRDRPPGSGWEPSPPRRQNVRMLITVLGVPVHPLLVHAVVVLIPLSALGAAAVAARPRWTGPYGPLVAAGALGGAVSATLAMLAGEQLEAALNITPEFAPVIEQHSSFGLSTVIASWPFAVLAVAAAVLARRPGGARQSRIAGVLAAVAGAVALVFTVLAGHTGSDAVWGFVTQ